jgi:hypothetical protein
MPKDSYIHARATQKLHVFEEATAPATHAIKKSMESKEAGRYKVNLSVIIDLLYVMLCKAYLT